MRNPTKIVGNSEANPEETCRNSQEIRGTPRRPEFPGSLAALARRLAGQQPGASQQPWQNGERAASTFCIVRWRSDGIRGRDKAAFRCDKLKLNRRPGRRIRITPSSVLTSSLVHRFNKWIGPVSGMQSNQSQSSLFDSGNDVS